MEIEVLRSFVEVAQLGSISVAAAKCHLTQSALSKRISSLEKELDTNLLERKGGKLALSAEGESFLDDAIAILDSHDRAIANLNRVKQLKREVLVIGYLQGAAQFLLPTICATFSEMEPNVELSLLAGEHTMLEDNLALEELDACITELFDPPHAPFRFIPLIRDYCVVATTDKQLAKKRRVRLKDLGGMKILSGSPTSSSYARTLKRVFIEEGIDADVRPTFNNYYEIAARLRAEAASTVIPSHLLSVESFQGVSIIPLDCSSLVHDIGLLYREDRANDALGTFIEVVQRSVPFRNYLSCSLPRLSKLAEGSS